MNAQDYIDRGLLLADLHAMSGPTRCTRENIENHMLAAMRKNKELREMLEEEAKRAKDFAERLEETERQKDALMEELENIATAEWREFDPDTRRCAYEFVLWAQSRARHTLNRVLSGDVTAPPPEDVKLVQVGPCACSDHECGECMKPEEDPAYVRLDEMVLREKS
jgi:hypothetical protein